jgi:hypothetical protein
MGLSHSPRIVTDNLITALDSSNLRSYPGSGTTWNDLSLNRYVCTCQTGSSFSSGAITFDGVNGYADFPAPIVRGQSTLTLIAWVYPIAWSTDYTTIFSNQESVNNNAFAIHKNGATANPGVTFGNNALVNFGAFSTNNWYNIAFTYDGTTLTTYQNGILQNTLALSGNIGTGSVNLTLGKSPTYAGRNFNGRVSSLFIYNSSLSSNDIGNFFAAYRGRFGL